MTLPLWIIAAHWFSDFDRQTNEMAMQKSKSWWWLTYHVITYTVWMMALYGVWTPFAGKFMLITFATHFITDAITSRITSRLWFLDSRTTCSCLEEGESIVKFNDRKRHWFFNVIGLDQLCHYATLTLTLRYLQS